MARLFEQLITFYVLFKLILSQNSCFEPFCNCDIENQILNCLTFTAFTQLDFKSNQIAWKEIQFFSFSRLKLDSNLNLQGLKLNTSIVPKVSFFNIDAFNIDYNPFKKIEYIGNGDKIELLISNSRFLFESSSTAADFCSFSESRDFIFSDLKISKLNINFVDLISSSRFCPLIFYNTSIESMEFLRPTGTINFVSMQMINDSKIKINELIITGGNDVFPKTLTKTSILNTDLFYSIKSLVLRNTYISLIEKDLFDNFIYLKNLKFFNIKLNNLLNDKTSNWLENLNSNENNNWDSTTALTQDIVNNKVFRMVLGEEVNFQFEDDDFCLFEKFPHKNLVLPLIETPSKLPCGCTIYHLYKYYMQYKPFLTKDELDMIPTNCLDINSQLLEEQLEYCDIDRRLNECKGLIYDNTTEQEVTALKTTIKPKSCIKDEYNCECNFDYFNYLSCNDPSITQVPNDLSTPDNVKWNFVSFSGSSINTVNEFNSLELDSNAVITVKNINTFGSRIFSKILTNTNFQFIVEDSNLGSLSRNLVFLNANLSLLEFNECQFISEILINAFEGATIDTFLIKYPKNFSIPLRFRPQPIFKTEIRKFKIENAYDSFSLAFSLDPFTIPSRLFQSLEELEIVNTQLYYIDGPAIEQLENLKVLKLNNINLIKVLDGIQSSETNWLSASQIEKLFIGREYEINFYFQNEYLCYFKEISNNMMIYIYDSIDSPEGPNCTCTLFWLYKNMDFDALKNDENSMYVPKCIKDLGNIENLNGKLNSCLNNTYIETYCLETTTSSSTSTTLSTSTSTDATTFSSSTSTTLSTSTSTDATTFSSSTSTKLLKTTPVIEKDNSSIKTDVAFYGFIVLSIFFVLLLGLFVFLFCYYKKKLKSNLHKVSAIKEETTIF